MKISSFKELETYQVAFAYQQKVFEVLLGNKLGRMIQSAESFCHHN